MTKHYLRVLINMTPTGVQLHAARFSREGVVLDLTRIALPKSTALKKHKTHLGYICPCCGVTFNIPTGEARCGLCIASGRRQS